MFHTGDAHGVTPFEGFPFRRSTHPRRGALPACRWLLPRSAVTRRRSATGRGFPATLARLPGVDPSGSPFPPPSVQPVANHRSSRWRGPILPWASSPSGSVSRRDENGFPPSPPLALSGRSPGATSLHGLRSLVRVGPHLLLGEGQPSWGSAPLLRGRPCDRRAVGAGHGLDSVTKGIMPLPRACVNSFFIGVKVFFEN